MNQYNNLLDKNKPLSVSYLNEIIKGCFDYNDFFRNLMVEGEISNFKGPNRSGHYYFSLKDEKSSINVVVFKFDSYHMNLDLKNGDKIIVKGQLTSYVPSGTYQIIVKEIIESGKGELLLKREKLKNKLTLEGFFDENHKLTIKKFPENIVIITGQNSAASKDFEYNLQRRWPLAHLVFIYALVQGADAPKDIINKINQAEVLKPDLIILGRGGGSIEDLSAFDDPDLIRRIYNLKIPLISAIGHEINETFTDLVADRYSSTPTGACEIAVPDQDDVLNDLYQIKSTVKTLCNNYFLKKEAYLHQMESNKSLTDIGFLIDENLNYLMKISEKINNFTKLYFLKAENKINAVKINVKNLNPFNILKKGYVVIYDADGNILINAEEIKKSKNIIIHTATGDVKATIKD